MYPKCVWEGASVYCSRRVLLHIALQKVTVLQVAHLELRGSSVMALDTLERSYGSWFDGIEPKICTCVEIYGKAMRSSHPFIPGRKKHNCGCCLCV